MPIDVTLAKAEEAANAGEYWRSREIIRSSLPNYGYDNRLLAALADVSLRMGDRMEAGRWLLTFAETPDDGQRAAIELFVNRHRSGGYRSLLSQLPAALRPKNLDTASGYLRTVLKELDAPQALEPETAASIDKCSPWFAMAGCALALATMLLCTVVGFITIVDWLLG